MKKCLLLTCLFLTSVGYAMVTIPQGELIVINEDTLESRFYSLDDYLEAHNMKSKDIPGLDGGWSTACYRGYIGIWLVEDNKLYLTNIGDYDYVSRHSKSKMADIQRMFGDKYKDGKVLADWCTDTIYVQYGAKVYSDMFVGTIREREKRFIVSQGIIIDETDYPTLTGTDQADFIRIWNGKRVYSGDAINPLWLSVRDNFEWTREMKKRCYITIVYYLNDDCSNAVLTGAEYEKMSTVELLSWHKNYCKDNKTDDDKREEVYSEMIDYYEEEIRELDAEIEKERRKYGAYIDEIKRILTPLKVETVIFRGRPYFSTYKLTYYFDSHKQRIGIVIKHSRKRKI